MYWICLIMNLKVHQVLLWPTCSSVSFVGVPGLAESPWGRRESLGVVLPVLSPLRNPAGFLVTWTEADFYVKLHPGIVISAIKRWHLDVSKSTVDRVVLVWQEYFILKHSGCCCLSLFPLEHINWLRQTPKFRPLFLVWEWEVGIPRAQSPDPKNTACSCHLVSNELLDIFCDKPHALGLPFMEQPSCLGRAHRVTITASKDAIVLIWKLMLKWYCAVHCISTNGRMYSF